MCVRNHSDVFVVSFDKLILNVEEIQCSLSDFIHCEFKIPFTEFHKHLPNSFQSEALNTIRPLEPATIDKWKLSTHRARLETLVKDEMPELCERLIELGYENDDDWVSEFISPPRNNRFQ